MDTLKILLVDDDEDDREFFEEALGSLSLTTNLHKEYSGIGCIDYLKNNSDNVPDLIFLDLNMPIMSGFECLSEIRKIEHFKDIIIAIYSTSSSERDIEETFGRGANTYIKKPSSFEELRTILKQVINTNWKKTKEASDISNYLLRVDN